MIIKKSAIGILLILCTRLASQELITKNLQEAYHQFITDAQLTHAISSFYVINAATGQVVFDTNSKIGLAAASTQKIITGITAFELLGKNFKYKTNIAYTGDIKNGILNGNIVITPSGDPSFGSWRWEFTKEDVILNKILYSLRKLKIRSVNAIEVNQSSWETNMIPDGWIWQDIGNYYGAGANKFNWRENQFDVILKSGKKLGDPVIITGYKPDLYSYSLKSLVTSAAKGTGDNAYIYFPFNSSGIIRGTIPVEENNFVISGALPSPVIQFVHSLQDSFKRNKISYQREFLQVNKINRNAPGSGLRVSLIYTHNSPSLDSLIYYFNRRSINLYGEAFVKTIALQKQGFARTDSGISLIKKFWLEKGLNSGELNLYDGSGLSPLNRVTTHALVEILKYARNQSWFPSFYTSLPEFNGIKMKSGTIADVKGFTGFHTSSNGTEYIFAFIVNNYSGSSSDLVRKMYKVLNVLK